MTHQVLFSCKDSDCEKFSAYCLKHKERFLTFYDKLENAAVKNALLNEYSDAKRNPDDAPPMLHWVADDLREISANKNKYADDLKALDLFLSGK